VSPARAALMQWRRAVMTSRLGRADSLDELREALRLMPAEPPSAARARMFAMMAMWMHVSGQPGADGVAEEGLAVARQAGDAAAEARALVSAAVIGARSEQSVRLLAMLARARTLAETARAYDSQLEAIISESDLLQGMGEHERAAQLARQGSRARPSSGWPGSAARCSPPTRPNRWWRWAGGTRRPA
jgi:hypothetical protein